MQYNNQTNKNTTTTGTKPSKHANMLFALLIITGLGPVVAVFLFV